MRCSIYLQIAQVALSIHQEQEVVRRVGMEVALHPCAFVGQSPLLTILLVLSRNSVSCGDILWKTTYRPLSVMGHKRQGRRRSIGAGRARTVGRLDFPERRIPYGGWREVARLIDGTAVIQQNQVCNFGNRHRRHSMSNIRGHESMAIDELAEIAWPYLRDIQINEDGAGETSDGGTNPMLSGNDADNPRSCNDKDQCGSERRRTRFSSPRNSPPPSP